MTEQVRDVSTDTLFCANHPTRETHLRCNRCEKPICPECAVLTSVGYRCRECVRGQQKVFETALWYDYAVAAGVAAVLSGIAGALISRLGFFVIFLAPVVGGAIAEVVRWAVRRRRSRYLGYAAVGGAILGALPMFLLPLLGVLLGAAGGEAGVAFGSLARLLWPGLYLFLSASTLYYRLRGIRI